MKGRTLGCHHSSTSAQKQDEGAGLVLRPSPLSYSISAEAPKGNLEEGTCDVVCLFSFLWKAATAGRNCVLEPAIFPGLWRNTLQSKYTEFGDLY